MQRSRGDWASAPFSTWLMPTECLCCMVGVNEPEQPLVCELCRARWRQPAHPNCPRCQHPVLAGLGCRLCQGWPAELELVRSAVLLDQPVRRLVHQFKYHGWHRLADQFAARMVSSLAGLGPGTLVPIPTDARRQRRRGYDHALRLAEALARFTGLEVEPNRLVRQRGTPSQVALTPEARIANLRGVFGAHAGSEPVILVDDVFTTGATLVSAATALAAAGASSVLGLTFARAEPPLAAAARVAATEP